MLTNFNWNLEATDSGLFSVGRKQEQLDKHVLTLEEIVAFSRASIRRVEESIFVTSITLIIMVFVVYG